jgi:hypothetical protein
MARKVHVSIESGNEIVREGLKRILHADGLLVDEVASISFELKEDADETQLIVIDAVEFNDGLVPLRRCPRAPTGGIHRAYGRWI